MGIKVDKDKNRVYINRKEYVLITEYDDEEFGKILKCCTVKFKDYKMFFLLEKEGKYETILDEEVFGKLLAKYQKPATNIIVD